MTVAFNHLLASHFLRVHRAALGILGEEQDAREVAQEALLKAYRARDRYDPGRPFYPWLHRIVRNACYDALARRRKRARSDVAVERMASAEPTPLDRAETADEIARLRLAMEKLSPMYREIIVMRHFEDLSYAEIGEILALPPGTVMSRLYRARKALAALMEAP
jgi:RNA polymerase sigma-70 factor (ECF subfamily)